MLELVQSLFTHQFEAALSTLGFAIARCPDEIWNAPVANYPFSQVAFHTLFYADYYLGPNEASFREQPFHRDNTALFGNYEQAEDVEPVTLYTREQLRLYLGFCRQKAIDILAAETEASLAAPAQFARRNFTR